MAALVSHAMRRFPATPPDDVYSYGLRGEGSHNGWSPSEEGESSLSRSMRYADPWLYGSVRAHGGLVLTPAFLLCTCTDYVNGTKRSSKKSPATCKKCKGTRLPFSAGDATKFGTVRCYPTSHIGAQASTPLRAGTMRVSSTSSRPSILPSISAADPYDLMRRSRLSVSESSSQFRARSISPNKGRTGETRSHSATRAKGKGLEPITSSSPTGRRSILECDINPYELMSSESDVKDASITLVNGQRIRVRPKSVEPDYEDIDIKSQSIRRHTISTPSSSSKNTTITLNATQQTTITTNNQNKTQHIITNNVKIKSPSLTNSNEIESESNRFKSILKKTVTTFNDTDTSGPEQSPSPSQKTGSHFYLPMPIVTTPRKKVQFLVENELLSLKANDNNNGLLDDESSEPEYDDVFEYAEERHNKESHTEKEEPTSQQTNGDTDKKVCKLRRSVSERLKQESAKVVFHDTMALRTRNQRGDSRDAFTGKDLERLDGLVSRTRKISPSKPRPKHPPPPPPQTNDENCKIKTKKTVIISVDNTKTVSTDEAIGIHKLNNLIGMKEEISVDCNNSNKKLKEIPPSAPPRKRSNNKQPQINIIQTPPTSPSIQLVPTVQTVKIESPTIDYSNRTVVQINAITPVHKLQIKNEFTEISNVQTVSVLDSPQRKTSIMINGDDCYSTVNVNDDVPLYQSSVVVKDSGIDIISSSINTVNKKSSSVYITGNFENTTSLNNGLISTIKTNGFMSLEKDIQATTNKTENIEKENCTQNKVTKDYDKLDSVNQIRSKHPIEKINENNIPSSNLLKELLRDPVEAVKRNLVPHVCGKSDMARRQRDKKLLKNNLINESLLESPLEDNYNISNLLEDSFLRLRNYDSINDDGCSEHSSSTQYELMDPGSDCYTDHSNRSSVTEEELANRSKFYELLADSAIVEVSENDDHHYESIKANNDPIYEEIEIPPPLPSNPPPSSLMDDLQLDKEFTTRSIFEGASKYDILSYLVDAKERGIVQEDSYTYNFNNSGVTVEEDTKDNYNRVSNLGSVSDSSEENSLIMTGVLIDDKATFQKAAEVERNDSGVGSETSKSSLSKYRSKQESSASCEDCETLIDSQMENEPLICRKCIKKRSERKEIITEIVETEEKYSRDLQIILEEFYQPMLVAGLLTPEQLSAIFLNAEELLENSQALAERLRDAVEIAGEQGDEDLLTVNIGKLFLEASPMLHAFETYCVRQGSASLLLASLEKDKELLRIFLRVSQMENTMLRRMNLNSFLMVPVQRVTKYPLLLSRLYKVTPIHHNTRERLKESQHKIELHLNHMNSQTKDVPSKLWRRIGSSSGRRSSTEMDLVNIKLRKIAVDVLEWNHDEARFALEGKLLFTQPTDNNWRKGRTIKLTPVNALLVTNGKQSSNRTSERADENGLTFSRHSGVREAALLLVRDKNGRYSLLREPLYLDRCVIAADPAWQSYFEVQELVGKDTFIFKAEDDDQTHTWYQQLQHHAQGMGAWRKRRNALANIMINGMGLRS